ncbi:cytochrome P450 [Trametes meyenii]|nr:cytochrome P450 [Trametes meyenii]
MDSTNFLGSAANLSVPWLSFLALSLTLLILLKTAYKARYSSSLPLPPGPRPLPILGNVLDFPKSHPGRGFRELSEKFGDVVYLQVLGRSIILVNTYEAACDLLDKRSANYSNRPYSAMVDMVGMDWIFVFKNNGPQWRLYRRALHNSFVPETLKRYFPVQLQATRELLREILENPTEFSTHIKFSLAAVILRIVYGLDATPGDDRYYKLVERLAAITNDISTPGRHWIEAFPTLKRLPSWLPGMGTKKQAAVWKEESVSVRDRLYASAKKAMDCSGIKESVITRLAEEGSDEALAKDVTGTIYSCAHDFRRQKLMHQVLTVYAPTAGADTTNAALHGFMLAMVMHPEAQRAAQEELDRVVGPDRLPDFSDRQFLPYIAALVKEVVRWHAVAPIGGAHCSVADDEYHGFFIPGGSIIIPNQWAMSRDFVHYPDPERFDPGRFLVNGRLNPNVRDPTSFAFGFGRRICPGRDFAQASLFIICASILHTFNISPGPPFGGNGPSRPMEIKTNNLAVSHPVPFECVILPRNSRIEELIWQDRFS